MSKIVDYSRSLYTDLVVDKVLIEPDQILPLSDDTLAPSRAKFFQHIVFALFVSSTE